jgi:phosphatidylglycerophosphate synthase
MSNSDSYSSLERKFLTPARRVLRAVYLPLVRILAALKISPNAISFSQVLLAFVVVYLMPTQPRIAFVLFVTAIVMDGLDGALARATNRATRFGALFDQYCDHMREVIVVAGLAWHGALNPFLAGVYGVTYPGFNLTLYLCNHYRMPLPFAIKSYVLVYPALFVFLWFGANWLDVAVSASLLSMGVIIILGLFKLQNAMSRSETLVPHASADVENPKS